MGGGNPVQKTKMWGGFCWWALGVFLFVFLLEQPVHPLKLAVHKSPWVIRQGLWNNGVRTDKLHANDCTSFEGHRAGKYR